MLHTHTHTHRNRHTLIGSPVSLCSGEGTFLSEPERDLLPPPFPLPVLTILLVLRDGDPAVRGSTTSVKKLFISPGQTEEGRESGREMRKWRQKERGGMEKEKGITK